MPVAEIVRPNEVPDFPPDELLLETDGEPLETDWHRIEINLLIELAQQNFAGREDYFAGGNMFLYFNDQQVRNKDYRGPDFFFVWGAAPMPLRPYWAIWKEGGRYPNVIVELLSASTAKIDRTTKKDLYEQTFRTREYFCYEPDTLTLEGWRLGKKYKTIKPDERGWLWSEELQLWLGLWEGDHFQREATWLRFYTSDGVLVPTLAESLHATVQKVQSAESKADEQRRRAEAAEAELAQLKRQLGQSSQ